MGNAGNAPPETAAEIMSASPERAELTRETIFRPLKEKLLLEGLEAIKKSILFAKGNVLRIRMSKEQQSSKVVCDATENSINNLCVPKADKCVCRDTNNLRWHLQNCQMGSRLTFF